MVAGSEQASLLSEFEGQFMEENDPDGFKRHEQGLSSQYIFKKHVNNLFTSSMGNPFMDDCPELLALESRNCATEAVVDTVRRIKEIGQSEYHKFLVLDRIASIHEPIKKNSLPLWKHSSPRDVPKSKQQVASLKSNCNLFSHLYIASKFRVATWRSSSPTKIIPGHPPFQKMGNSICPRKKQI